MAEETKNAAEEAEKQEGGAPEEATEEVAAEEAAPEVEVVVAKVEEIVPGMVVRVHQKIKEAGPKGEERERLQVFEGTVIAVKGQDAQSRTITVRKVTGGIGVERIFPVKSPVVARIEVVKQLKVRRAKLYFMRDHKKKVKEKSSKKK